MFRSYLKTAWRSIEKYRAYSIINILGLALGIAASLIIVLIVKYELGYDRFNTRADRIYRVTLNAIDFNPSVSPAIGPAIRTDFPELEQVARVWLWEKGLVKVGETLYDEKNYAFAEKEFPAIFDYQWIAGDPRTALSAPNTVVLTESIAHKYFGKTDAMGQVIQLNKEYTLKVTGLIKDVPPNTHLPFNFLVSYQTISREVQDASFYSIPGHSFCYILIPEGSSIQQFQKRIPAFIAKNWGADLAKEARLPLQPLTNIHFDQRYLNDTISPTTSRETYWGLAAVAVLIIVIACINFINLATAQAIRRAKEVGVRKVLGSSRSQLIAQFLGETSLLVILAVVLGIVATVLFMPLAGQWLGVELGARQLLQPGIVALTVGVTVSINLLAGLYPAFVQSAFRPADSLKNSAAGISFGKLSLRKALVIVQFAISQILIVGTLVVAYQMDYFQNRDLGFNKDAVITFSIPDRDKRKVLEQQLAANPGVKEVCFASAAPVYNASFTSFSSPELGVTKDDVTEMKFIDEKYIAMFDIHVLAGENMMTDEDKPPYHVMVNETLIRKLGIQDPGKAIGAHFMFNGWEAIIKGVVQDFQSESKHKKRRPCVLMRNSKRLFMANVRLQPGNMNQTIAGISKSWRTLFPDNVFSYEFLDDHIASWYSQEQKEYTAFKLFSTIAILIGCLGLYGLVAFAAAQRTKEVGIRKVLGASLGSIVFLFTREFIVPIIVAFVVAAPVAYFVMNKWLQNFAYQISIGAWIFVVAIAASAIIAACTISFQAVKAAIVNPVKSLRSE